MRLETIFLLTCAFADVSVTLRSGRYCPLACDTTLNYATFNDTDSWLPRRVRSCRSDLRTTSFYLCIDRYCEFDRPAASYLGEQSSWCDEHAGSALPDYHELINHWKTHHGQDIAKLHANDAFEWPTLHQVVIPDSSFFVRAFTTIVRGISHLILLFFLMMIGNRFPNIRLTSCLWLVYVLLLGYCRIYWCLCASPFVRQAASISALCLPTG